MKRMKAAVIGCGAISEAYMQNMKSRFSILELVACSDLDVARRDARAQQFGVRGLTTEEILSDPDIELVINLTNPSVHYTVTKAALEAGKHVYSEKMMAVETAEAKELCELAKAKGVSLGVAPDTFLGATLQTARYLLDKGMIGKPLSFVASLTRDFEVLGEILPHLCRRGGGIAVDTGCYYLTALASLFGPANTAFAFTSVNEATRPKRRTDRPGFGESYTIAEDNVIAAAIQFANGVQGVFHNNSDTVFDEGRILTIYGTEGVLSIDDPNCFGSKLTLQKPFSQPIEFPPTHGFADECRGVGAAEMAWAIRAGRPHRASMEMGYHVLKLLRAIEWSGKTGQPITIESRFERPAMLTPGYVPKSTPGSWTPTEETALV